MKINLNQDWQTILSDEITKPYFNDLMANVEEEYENNICFPPIDLIFSALNHCSFQDTKVVIIGQDPYHGTGEANGLSFSVNDNIKIPPSLRNIYRELNTDFDSVFMPTSGNLESWAKQGVLLLNASLTVRKDTPNSHKHLKWNLFTDAVIQAISDKKENVVFLLWGAFAQKKGSKIDTAKHLVLESGHPSPMSANQGKWFGNKHFTKTNTFLISKKIPQIKWL
ncbi:uracil-DNA glycosylase [Flavobacterium branchiarum]|uniref:Uracil-DNA glycosylase n=1 Tax=Flavobacterium branchiarum TaxID=1114870 RepID=A0ABV5FRS5_9FLAO|nr:uracil-DNA glycosylase [Flavobacterium branchiarum]MDN3673372.1 uracil-DNA glycosylase [Flavobacterium branchiarum]